MSEPQDQVTDVNKAINKVNSSDDTLVITDPNDPMYQMIMMINKQIEKSLEAQNKKIIEDNKKMLANGRPPGRSWENPY